MLRKELIIFRRGLIASGSICLKKCVRKRYSTQVDYFGEEISEISLLKGRKTL